MLEEVAMIRAAIEGMFPLKEAASRPYLEICFFYDQFAPHPLRGRSMAGAYRYW